MFPITRAGCDMDGAILHRVGPDLPRPDPAWRLAPLRSAVSLRNKKVKNVSGKRMSIRSPYRDCSCAVIFRRRQQRDRVRARPLLRNMNNLHFLFVYSSTRIENTRIGNTSLNQTYIHFAYFLLIVITNILKLSVCLLC